MMPWVPWRRVTALAVLAVITAAGAAGCSAAPRPAPYYRTKSAENDRGTLGPALLVQCTLTRTDLIPAADLVGQSTWLHGRSIRISLSTIGSTQFQAWYEGHDAIRVAGKSWLGWQNWMYTHDTLPVPVCGTEKASTLERQVYGQSFGSRNPWEN